MRNIKFCYTPLPFRVPAGIFRAVAKKGSYWKVGETLEICFLDGTGEQRSQFKGVISELRKVVNLNFVFVSDPEKSDIRIAFKKGVGSWSYLGSTATFIPKNQPTLNIGWDDPDGGTMRHEFGHALNLYHEHQNPDEGIKWNEKIVIEDLSGPPNNWSINQIRNNVLNAVDPNSFDFTKYDADSVMGYFYPGRWTLDGIAGKQNTYYSQTDLRFLKNAYPFPDEPVQPVEPEDEESDPVEPITPDPVDPDGGDEEVTIIDEGKIILNFLNTLIRDSKDLKKMREDQLMVICDKLSITASVDDLKRDTISRVYDVIKQ